MVQPYKGNLGVISLGGTVIGNGLVDGNVGFTKELSEFYRQGGTGEPTQILQGHRTYRGKFDYAYLDANTIINAALGTTEYTIIYYPKGTASGNPIVTISNCPLGGFTFNQEEDGVVRIEGQEFAGTAITFSTA